VKDRRAMEHPLAPLAGPGPVPCAWAASGPAGSGFRARPLFPWEDGDLGPVRAGWRTLTGVLLRPNLFFTRHRPGRGSGPVLVFGLVATATGMMLALFLSRLAALLPSGPADGGGSPAPGLGLVLTLTGIVAAPALALALLVFQALWIHFWLVLFRAGRKGLGATLRAVCYASPAALFLGIPFLGPVLAWLSGLLILTIGLARLQGVGALRILAALFLPPLALGLGLAGLG